MTVPCVPRPFTLEQARPGLAASSASAPVARTDEMVHS